MDRQPSSADPHVLSELGTCRCGWEAQPQAFRWFAERGVVLPELPSNNPLSLCAPRSPGVADDTDGCELRALPDPKAAAADACRPAPTIDSLPAPAHNLRAPAPA